MNTDYIARKRDSDFRTLVIGALLLNVAMTFACVVMLGLQEYRGYEVRQRLSNWKETLRKDVDKALAPLDKLGR